MACDFKIVRDVQFSETDMAGIMHFSNFFRYMEAAEHAFFRSLGFSIHTTHPEPVGWPRVHADCDFRYPLKFEDSVEVHLMVQEKTAKTLSYKFVFRKLNEDPVRVVARGVLTVACVTRDETGRMKSYPIPAAIADKIELAPPEMLRA